MDRYDQECKHQFPLGDWPTVAKMMRRAHADGAKEADFCFSGWGAGLTQAERAVVDNTVPAICLGPGRVPMDSPKIKCSTDAEWREYFERQCTSLRQSLASKTAEVEALKEKVGRMDGVVKAAQDVAMRSDHREDGEYWADLNISKMVDALIEYEKVLTPPASEKSQVRINAEEDPDYCPYCLRCSATVRMKKVEPFYWRCACGAEHDERTTPPASPKSEEKKCTCGEDSPDSLVVHRKDGPCYLRERLAGPGWVHLSLGYPWREPDRCGEGGRP